MSVPEVNERFFSKKTVLKIGSFSENSDCEIKCHRLNRLLCFSMDVLCAQN